MIWLWSLFAALTGLAGIRYWRRVRSGRGAGLPPQVDDEALRQILETGSLEAGGEDDEPLDMEAAAEAEEDFWSESWDEPEEYPR